VKKVKNFDAMMGGTEILAPLQDVYAEPVDIELPRQIYLLTDGAVNNTK
jgi:von Willebrand factor A domain-containing protein 5